MHYQNQTSGQRPPPTFAASRQRRDLIIAQPPEGVSKEGGPQPSLFGRFKGKRFLRKGGNRNPPFLKWRSLVTFFRQGKKVTRRRQKKGNGKPSGGAEPRPYARLPKAHASYVRGDVGIAPYVPSTESVHVIHPGGQGRPPLQGPKKHPAGGKKNEKHGQRPTPTPQKSAAASPRRPLCNMFLLAEEVC